MRSSRDLPPEPLREDKSQNVKKAVIEDADKTDVADRDRVHGDGETLGLDQPERSKTRSH